MHAISLIILALAAFSLALPSLIPRNTTCSLPTSFTISAFSSFTPAENNTIPQETTFEYYDSTFTAPIHCTVTGKHRPSDLTACTDAAVSFKYNGTGSTSGVLTIKENVAGCGISIVGSVGVATFCYPVTNAFPFGVGTECQTPTVSFGGVFSPATVVG
ncbi:hypothetical protein EG329_005504 [Mollisiaceae sp. DMI_Dod_QoI]|nr:hypothetical protein EG329_005504 [Helotiales sp. DMI_Dod_QoI]